MYLAKSRSPAVLTLIYSFSTFNSISSYNGHMDQNPPTATGEKSNNKLVGWILIILGILIILSTAAIGIMVLTGKANPPTVMNIQGPSIPIPNAAETIDTSQLPPQIAQVLKQNPQKEQSSVKLISDEAFSKIINISIFYFLIMFTASIGAKIAAIGTQLVRTIKVTGL